MQIFSHLGNFECLVCSIKPYFKNVVLTLSFTLQTVCSTLFHLLHLLWVCAIPSQTFNLLFLSTWFIKCFCSSFNELFYTGATLYWIPFFYSHYDTLFFVAYRWSHRFDFKVVLYTKGSTIYEPTSQYGDLNILWKCLYRSTFFYIIIAQWSRALVLWTKDPEFKSVGGFC